MDYVVDTLEEEDCRKEIERDCRRNAERLHPSAGSQPPRHGHSDALKNEKRELPTLTWPLAIPKTYSWISPFTAKALSVPRTATHSSRRQECILVNKLLGWTIPASPEIGGRSRHRRMGHRVEGGSPKQSPANCNGVSNGDYSEYQCRNFEQCSTAKGTSRQSSEKRLANANTMIKSTGTATASRW